MIKRERGYAQFKIPVRLFDDPVFNKSMDAMKGHVEAIEVDQLQQNTFDEPFKVMPPYYYLTIVL
jgi:hypothetical protein